MTEVINSPREANPYFTAKPSLSGDGTELAAGSEPQGQPTLGSRDTQMTDGVT